MSQVEQLNQAKQFVQQSPSAFNQVVQMVVPIAISSQDLPIQQWCTDFFYEFTLPEKREISFYQKQDAAMILIGALKQLIHIKDVTILKNIILTMTNIYELILDLVAKTSNQQLWNDFIEVKKFIIDQWSTTYPLNSSNNKEIDETKSIGVKLTIVKFIVKVIVVQTPTNNATKDPRRANQLNGGSSNNEISISNVSDNHIVLSKNILDAEAQGLLDLLINYLNDEEYLIPQKFISILNGLIIIIQKRYHIFQGKILNSILNFKLDEKFQLSKDSNLKFKLSKRYVDRYIKNLLNYCSRANIITQSNPLSLKAQKWVTLIDTKMNEQKRKGILTDLNDDDQPLRKKIKLESTTTTTPLLNNSMISDDNSYASLYRLIDSNNELTKFDVSQIPSSILSNLAISTLLNTDTQKLISALSIVSARYTDLINKSQQVQQPQPPQQQVPPPPPPPTTATSQTSTNFTKNEIDDTEKDDLDNNQILSQNEQDDSNLETTYTLPLPNSLSLDEKKIHLKFIIENFFKISNYKIEDNTPENAGLEPLDNTLKINKIAITKWSKNSWLILLTRLATRGLASTNQEESEILSDIVRESLFQFFLENIHERIDIIIGWLNEEWFAEFNKNLDDESLTTNDDKIPNYLKWTGKILDTMIPFLESNDRKIFIRLLSDLPYLNNELILKLKSLCIDPERSSLGFQSLQFLIMFKPPVKQGCIDILKDLYENNEDLKESAKKLLQKYVPGEYD
ncbi:Symplekin [Wickerhamomyces ciferrii]|uniref:Symplekin n=1 Tax=Wickerhamomyces ciferrii (strain ATCC 14091 / BCRC 22168 / CBS 111 / JCM 3599 / NBRC 0793 / NRRL Y-1031 F-60-10) TaxID=1206466 RepID=K0KTG4_WICCF|nr:Symplekin [Wickerhamomyces ciferrii]CCH45302.1 Symplekin [Wickerhamomyces ciferrii]